MITISVIFGTLQSKITVGLTAIQGTASGQLKDIVFLIHLISNTFVPDSLIIVDANTLQVKLISNLSQ